MNRRWIGVETGTDTALPYTRSIQLKTHTNWHTWVYESHEDKQIVKERGEESTQTHNYTEMQ